MTGGYRDRQRLIRRVVCVRGEMDFRLDCEPRFTNGRDRREVVVNGEGALFRSPALALTLSAPTPIEPTKPGASASVTLTAGEAAISAAFGLERQLG